MHSTKLDDVIKLIEAQKVTEAMNLFTETEAEESVKYYLVKGILEQKFQNWGNAMNAFLKVLEFDPENTEAEHRLHIIQNIINFWNREMFNP